MLTLQKYLEIAEKIIRKKGYSSLLNDEDAISYVAEYMMRADECFNGIGNKYGWRAKHGEYGLMNYIRKLKKKNNVRSLNFSYNDISLINMIGKDENPSKICENKEIAYNILNGLEHREKICIEGYYMDGRTLQSIADELYISKERVRQIIEKTIKKIRKNNNVIIF